MERINIQTQDECGVWRTVANIINNSQRILPAMQEAQKAHRNKRVRAVDNAGRVMDIL